MRYVVVERTKDGTWHRSSAERLGRLVHHVSVGGSYSLRIVLQNINVPAAVEQAPDSVEEWDSEITAVIRLLSSLRRGIRDAQPANA